MTLDLEATVSGLREWLTEDQGMYQVRVDRFCLEPEPKHGAFNLEIGTVFGEVRVRINAGNEQIGHVDIRSAAHLPAAKKRLATFIKKGGQYTWVKGQGWKKVKA